MSWGDWDGYPGSRSEVALAISEWLGCLLFCVFVVVVAFGAR